jgi:putative transcriptional regulator
MTLSSQVPLYLDHSAGALDAAGTLIVNTHLRLRTAGLSACHLGDVLGGALLERIEPVAMEAFPLARGADRPSAPDRCAAPEARAASLIQLAQTDPAALAWRWRWFGVQEHSLPVPGARLLKMNAGASAPRHTHHAFELTLVLSGRYGDEEGLYEPGDVAIAGPGEVHRPHTLPDSGCLCLTAVVGDSAIEVVRQRLMAAHPGQSH